MELSFPQSKNTYLKAVDFHDNERVLTFKGFEKKHNEDFSKDGKVITSWKDKVKYVLLYSYPEWAFDKTTGEKRTGEDGQPFRNRYYDEKYPHGYTILYHFEEGQLESGSLPLFKAFSSSGVRAGDKVSMLRTGKEVKEIKWTVRKVGSSKIVHPDELDTIQLDDIGGMQSEESVPF